MERAEVPSYAVFDDLRYSQRFIVTVRWALIIGWLFLHNYRPDQGMGTSYWISNGMALTVAAVNGYLHWRIINDRPLTKPYALAMSALDLAAITAGIAITTRFDNAFFVLYYPALLGISLVLTSRSLIFAITTSVAGAYIAISVLLAPGIDFEAAEERVLVMRIISMFAVVAAGNLITGIERFKRREAVEAERVRMEENMELQSRARDAERELESERIRLSQEIHDGAAQTAFVLNLGLETCQRLVREDNPELIERLKALRVQSKQALWELRYPINLGPLFEGKSLAEMLENHIKNFETLTSISTTFLMTGIEMPLSAVIKQRLFSVPHNALTNTYRHAQATNVRVEMVCDDDGLALTIADDGIGMTTTALDTFSGHGLRNMRRVEQELGGALNIVSAPGEGTTVLFTLPRQEVANGQAANSDC